MGAQEVAVGIRTDAAEQVGGHSESRQTDRDIGGAAAGTDPLDAIGPDHDVDQRLADDVDGGPAHEAGSDSTVTGPGSGKICMDITARPSSRRSSAVDRSTRRSTSIRSDPAAVW